MGALGAAGCSSGEGDAAGPTPHDAGAEASEFARTSTGCGQGTSCSPATDLAAPDAALGFQIATPDQGITVQPGHEQFLCYYRTVPNTATVDTGKFQPSMTPATTHHF